MIHLRLVVPADLAEQVLALLGSLPSALNLIHLPGAARAPEGDLVLPATVILRALSLFPDSIGRTPRRSSSPIRTGTR